jgi:DNA helicase-2/ATP-dependent DNA helicase PcrA
MAGTIGGKSNSLDQVIDCIDDRRSFLLEAGAGSGKTWSLIETLKYLLEKQSAELLTNNQQIVCITYTNVAKDEISERINNNPLVLVRTIHEFLWDVIRNYQMELKSVLLDYNDEIKNRIEDLKRTIESINIEYTQYGRRFEAGRITHDDVLEFSSRLFHRYSKLQKIVSNKYPYIFVDEYQDTEKRIVDLLVNDLLDSETKNIVIGFFGDSMQKIYNQGIGVITSEKLKLVTKEDNFRCSLKVIDLLNKIRPSLIQKPSGKNVEGQISFFYCTDTFDGDNYAKVLESLKSVNGWDFSPANSKILLLTHKGIANKLDYPNLLDLYLNHYAFGRERLFEKEDRFADLFLNKLETLVSLYKQQNYGQFIEMLGKEGFSLSLHKHKIEIKEQMDELDSIRTSGTIGQVLDYVFEKQLLTKPQRIKDFEREIGQQDLDDDGIKKKEFYDHLRGIGYKEVINLYKYIEDQTPFSTKHGVKGAEYDNVLMVIDDKSWNQYSFNDVFANKQKNIDRYNRTRNLLYVCCSRAKDKLALLSLTKTDEAAMRTIYDWFGKDNVYNVSNL